MSVRVRIAPSPTGDPHVGTAYIALFNTAFTRQRGGKFILRIEDTDQARSSRESEAGILDALRWLGFTWDEGPDIGGPHAPYRQSERLPIYRQHAELLFRNSKAYWCDCTKDRLDAVRKEAVAKKAAFHGYDGHCRSRGLTSGSVLRLKIPREEGAATSWKDPARGIVRIEHKEFDDQVLLKGDGFPTYHLANVVDDHSMEITHVIRGEEWISSTPKHILLYESFVGRPPTFFTFHSCAMRTRRRFRSARTPCRCRGSNRPGTCPKR
jgi:glutamyl-tRNA synthetase